MQTSLNHGGPTFQPTTGHPQSLALMLEPSLIYVGPSWIKLVPACPSDVRSDRDLNNGGQVNALRFLSCLGFFTLTVIPAKVVANQVSMHSYP